MLRSERCLARLPRLARGQQVYVSFKHPPQGIPRLGLVGFEEVPITNPTIAARLRRAIIFSLSLSSLEPKSRWR